MLWMDKNLLQEDTVQPQCGHSILPVFTDSKFRVLTVSFCFDLRFVFG